MEIEQLIYMHKDRLYRLCMYLEKDAYEAEELFQDTWVKAIEKWQSYDGEKDFVPWITQIAVNTYRDRLRKLKREMKRYLTLEDEALIQTQTPPMEQELALKDTLDRLSVHIGSLPDKYKLPLILVSLENHTYAEVAIMLHIEEKLVKSRVYDARQKLKKALEKEGYNEG